MQAQLGLYDDYNLETKEARAWLAANITLDLKHTQEKIWNLEQKISKWDEILSDEDPWPDRIIEVAEKNFARLQEKLEMAISERARLSDELYRVLKGS